MEADPSSSSTFPIPYAVLRRISAVLTTTLLPKHQFSLEADENNVTKAVIVPVPEKKTSDSGLEESSAAVQLCVFPPGHEDPCEEDMIDDGVKPHCCEGNVASSRKVRPTKTLIQLLCSMHTSVCRLEDWVQELRETKNVTMRQFNTLVERGALIRGGPTEEGTISRLDDIEKQISALYEEWDNMLMQPYGLDEMIRELKGLVNGMVGAMRLVGLFQGDGGVDVDTLEKMNEEEMYNKMVQWMSHGDGAKRQNIRTDAHKVAEGEGEEAKDGGGRDGVYVDEEDMALDVLRVLEEVKVIVEDDDPLIFDLTGEWVDNILDRPGGLRKWLQTYREMYIVVEANEGNDVNSMNNNSEVVTTMLTSLRDDVRDILDQLTQLSTSEQWGTMLVWLQQEKEETEWLMSYVCSKVRASITRRALDVVDKAIQRGSSTALFARGLQLHFFRKDKGFEYFKMAEERGCTHPQLYENLGTCYAGGDGVTIDYSKALEYYQKAIEGGYDEGHAGICKVLYLNRLGREPPSYAYSKSHSEEHFHALDREGVKSSFIIDYIVHHAYDVEETKMTEDCLRGKEVGSIACTGRLFLHYWRASSDKSSAIEWLVNEIESMLSESEVKMREKMVGRGRLVTLGQGDAVSYQGGEEEGEENKREKTSSRQCMVCNMTKSGMIRSDGLIILLIEALTQAWSVYSDLGLYIPSEKVVGGFTTVGEMALYYCDILIARGSSRGYLHKGRIYCEGLAGVEKDEKKGMSIWHEADEVGLADYTVYKKLIDLYIYYHDNPQYRAGSPCIEKCGHLIMEYCNKAAEVAISSFGMSEIYHALSRVYTDGIPPVPSDSEKGEEYGEKATKLKTNYYEDVQ